MSDRERKLLSTDPKDPKYWLRVTRDEDSGIVEIAEEELTSARLTAQVTEARASLLFTSEQAHWLINALTEVVALRRLERNKARVEEGLMATLQARKLGWILKEYDTVRAVWDTRNLWAVKDTGDAWAAWVSWAAGDAWIARAAWASWAALTGQFAVAHAPASRSEDVSGDPDLTVGLRDAYHCGLGIALPTGPNELGWAMDGSR